MADSIRPDKLSVEQLWQAVQAVYACPERTLDAATAAARALDLGWHLGTTKDGYAVDAIDWRVRDETSGEPYMHSFAETSVERAVLTALYHLAQRRFHLPTPQEVAP